MYYAMYQLSDIHKHLQAGWETTAAPAQGFPATDSDGFICNIEIQHVLGEGRQGEAAQGELSGISYNPF